MCSFLMEVMTPLARMDLLVNRSMEMIRGGRWNCLVRHSETASRVQLSPKPQLSGPWMLLRKADEPSFLQTSILVSRSMGVIEMYRTTLQVASIRFHLPLVRFHP